MNEINTSIKQPYLIPMLALRGMVIFPGMILHFDVGRKKSIVAMNEAMKINQSIFLVAQKDIREDEPTPQNLYNIGTIATIKQILHLPGEGIRVLVEGVSRASIVEISQEDPYYIALAQECEIKEAAPKDIKSEALIRKAQELVGEFSEVGPKLPQDIFTSALASENSGALADLIASNILLKIEDKQAVLEVLNENKRLELVLKILEREISILELENEISEKVRSQIDKNQREYYLREQYKTIGYELGEGENPQEEAYDYHERIAALNLSEEVALKLHKETERISRMPFGSHEASVIRTWLDTCLALPWNKSTKDKYDIEHAQKILDNDHYGLVKVKERILEFMAVRKLNPNIKGQIICLVGPPGVGKTSIAKSIAKVMGRKYARVSLGGVRDEAEIRGHRKTYIGAMPGRIINAISQSGSNNPLILLDEIDKLCNDFRGDPSSALLEVLDSEQNYTFRDHYIEMPFDLSNVLFITTANTTEYIPSALLDRMEVITLSSYTREEKFNIATKHLLLKQLKRHGLNKRTLKIANSAIYGLIDFYTREAGVRNLERQIAALCRKAAKEIASNNQTTVSISGIDLERLLGPNKYKTEELSLNDEVGVVTGLAWTSVGGETMPIEVCVLEGSGKIELTGSLGDVMKESARAAISYIRSRVKELNIDGGFYKDKDIHIHVPEGAIPKDGPSAGITMATALISALLNLPVHREVAMTGEITLRGRVLPIGGLKEKTMAAYRAGIKTIIVPKDNFADLSEIDQIVKDNITFITADNMDTVVKNAIIFPEIAIDKKDSETDLSKINQMPIIDKPNNRPVITQ
jgi:ATP-dependent Lon protease